MDCNVKFNEVIDLKLKELYDAVKNQELLQSKKEYILEKEIDELSKQVIRNEEKFNDQLIRVEKGFRSQLSEKDEFFENQLKEKDAIIEERDYEISILKEKIDYVTERNVELEQTLEDLRDDNESKLDNMRDMNDEFQKLQITHDKIKSAYNSNIQTFLKKEREFKATIAEMNNYIERMRRAIQQHILESDPNESSLIHSRSLSPILEEDEYDESDGEENGTGSNAESAAQDDNEEQNMTESNADSNEEANIEQNDSNTESNNSDNEEEVIHEELTFGEDGEDNTNDSNVESNVDENEEECIEGSNAESTIGDNNEMENVSNVESTIDRNEQFKEGSNEQITEEGHDKDNAIIFNAEPFDWTEEITNEDQKVGSNADSIGNSTEMSVDEGVEIIDNKPEITKKKRNRKSKKKRTYRKMMSYELF